MPIKICKICGQQFKAKTKRGDFCAGRCFLAHEAEGGRRRLAMYSPERRRASNLVYTAVRQGRLVPQPCEVCGKADAVAHHDNYAEPLNVRWLCRSHHRIHHHKFGPGLSALCEEIST